MRRALALVLLVTTAAACSYYYEARERAVQDNVVLDAELGEQSFQVRLCWTGQGEPDTSQLAIIASTPGEDLQRVVVYRDVYDEFDTLGPTPPEEWAAPGISWTSYFDEDPLSACTVGTTVHFKLLDAEAGPATVHWEVIGTVGSDQDEAVERLALELIVEPAAP